MFKQSVCTDCETNSFLGHSIFFPSMYEVFVYCGRRTHNIRMEMFILLFRPCRCYVILVFAFVAVFICAASLFSLFHRYIVAGDKICCCPPQLQVERETEKHDVVWMLTTVKSTEFGILTGKTSTVLLYSEYLFTVQCFGYYMTGKIFGGEKSASCSITNSPH